MCWNVFVSKVLSSKCSTHLPIASQEKWFATLKCSHGIDVKKMPRNGYWRAWESFKPSPQLAYSRVKQRVKIEFDSNDERKKTKIKHRQHIFVSPKRLTQEYIILKSHTKIAIGLGSFKYYFNFICSFQLKQHFIL